MVSHVISLPSPATEWGPKGPVYTGELSPAPTKELKILSLELVRLMSRPHPCRTFLCSLLGGNGDGALARL